MPTNLEQVIHDAAHSDYPDYVDVETVVAHAVTQWMKKQYNESNGDFDFVMFYAKAEFRDDEDE